MQLALQFPECVDVSEHPDMLISAATLRHTKLISSSSLAFSLPSLHRTALLACRSLLLQDTITQTQNVKSRVSHCMCISNLLYPILVPVGHTFSDSFHYISVQFTDSSFSLKGATYEIYLMLFHSGKIKLAQL
jgi:hypothetical protein